MDCFYRLMRSFPKLIFKINHKNNLSKLENLEEGNAVCLAEITLFPMFPIIFDNF